MALYKHIPNTVTSLNLFSGILGVIFCLQGNIFAAFVMMLAASVCWMRPPPSVKNWTPSRIW